MYTLKPPHTFGSGERETELTSNTAIGIINILLVFYTVLLCIYYKEKNILLEIVND